MCARCSGVLVWVTSLKRAAWINLSQFIHPHCCSSAHIKQRQSISLIAYPHCFSANPYLGPLWTLQQQVSPLFPPSLFLLLSLSVFFPRCGKFIPVKSGLGRETRASAAELIAGPLCQELFVAQLPNSQIERLRCRRETLNLLHVNARNLLSISCWEINT